MPNLLTITVETPDELLNAGAYGTGAVIRIQTSATETGVYADVTGTGSTPTIAIVAGTRSYQGYDPAGTVSSWYKTRFENVGATRLSDWSDAFQVAPEGSGLICGLWDVKQALGITGTTNDEDIVERIRRVTEEIQHLTGRLFLRIPASGTTTFLFDIEKASRELRVPKGIAAATTLEVAQSSQPETSGTYTTLAAGTWYLRPAATERSYGWPATRICLSDTSGSYFAVGYNTVRLTGALGWDAVPANVAGVAERAVVADWLAKGSAGVNAAVGPTGAMTILRHISPADHETLMRYAEMLS